MNSSLLQIKSDNNLMESTLNLNIAHNNSISLPSLTLNKIKDLKFLQDLMKNQKSIITYNEEDQKKFKALQKYGDVLKKVEKLFNILPTEMSLTSLDDISKGLSNLHDARKTAVQQTEFCFYQNYLTNTLKNILNIEKDFQKGNISEQTAYEQLKSIKKEMSENKEEIPNSLINSYKEVYNLLGLYSDKFAKVSEDKLETITPLIKTDITDNQKLSFNKINNQTNELLISISNFQIDVNQFVPEVDISKLKGSLEEADEMINQPNFNASNLNKLVKSIDSNTNKLMLDQTIKNKI